MKNECKKYNVLKYNSLSLANERKLYHGFFTRNGGVSSDDPFSSLNCSYSSSDNTENISSNRKLIAGTLGFSIDQLKTIKQIHSNRVITLCNSEIITSGFEADAIVTNLSNVLIGIQTADCVPILFYEKMNSIIAAAHAGWKGAVSGIIENTINAMLMMGAELRNIKAVIGPCIQQYSYEVNLSFYQDIIKIDTENKVFFISSNRDGHYLFDLPGFCIHKLRKKGISKIENLGIDTYSNNDVFFSYRFATHQQTESSKPIQYGRQLSVLGMQRS